MRLSKAFRVAAKDCVYLDPSPFENWDITPEALTALYRVLIRAGVDYLDLVQLNDQGTPDQVTRKLRAVAEDLEARGL